MSTPWVDGKRTADDIEAGRRPPAHQRGHTRLAVLLMHRSVVAGIWLMQGWLFVSAGYWTGERVQAYLGGVPDDGLIILVCSIHTALRWCSLRRAY